MEHSELNILHSSSRGPLIF